MSTRAMYTFYEEQEHYHVYKHSDGYPSGAAGAIQAATEYAWPLPRYDGSEFAAAFIAANKSYWINRELRAYRERDRETLAFVKKYREASQGGQVYLMPQGAIADVEHGDLEYRYEVRCLDNTIYVKAFVAASGGHGNEPIMWKQIFNGSLSEFDSWAEQYDKAA